MRFAGDGDALGMRASDSGPAGFDALHAMYAEVQAAKVHLNDAATRVVDRALALSGGAEYMADPLAKAWRGPHGPRRRPR